jgi:hypothetical protein
VGESKQDKPGVRGGERGVADASLPSAGRAGHCETNAGPTRLEVLECMSREGGGFVSRLAEAWMRADADNDRRLYLAFGHYFDEYRERLIKRAARKAVARG